MITQIKEWFCNNIVGFAMISLFMGVILGAISFANWFPCAI
jgi:predicted negative regulator of RcsB-dependent stress response